MNTTSLPTQASVASWLSMNGAVSTQSSATSIVLAAAVQGGSHSFPGYGAHAAPGLVYSSLDPRPGTALSALGRFYARRAFGLQMADRSRHCTRSLSFYDKYDRAATSSGCRLLESHRQQPLLQRAPEREKRQHRRRLFSPFFQGTGITNHLENGGTLEVIADGQAKRLYPQYGFQPTAPASIGMAQWLGR